MPGKLSPLRQLSRNSFTNSFEGNSKALSQQRIGSLSLSAQDTPRKPRDGKFASVSLSSSQNFASKSHFAGFQFFGSIVNNNFSFVCFFGCFAFSAECRRTGIKKYQIVFRHPVSGRPEDNFHTHHKSTQIHFKFIDSDMLGVFALMEPECV